VPSSEHNFTTFNPNVDLEPLNSPPPKLSDFFYNGLCLYSKYVWKAKSTTSSLSNSWTSRLSFHSHRNPSEFTHYRSGAKL